jgi:pimeloyl-ACP methyl ester carboxylesterase
LPETHITSGILTFGENKVHCLRMGEGKKLLIAFHGFGMDAGIFKTLLPSLGKEYTIVAIDLPGHGQTKWEDRYFDQKALMAVVQGIKNDFGAEKFALIGHSLGGRVALNIAGVQPSWVDQLILLAPDGLEKNFWYHFATRNILGKALFKNILRRPGHWLKKLSFLESLKIVPTAQYKLASATLLHKETNERIAYVWPTMSLLVPLLKIIRWNIKKHKITTHIFMGRHDPIFHYRQGEKFTRSLKYSQFHLLNTGHNLLLPEFLPQIAECLK